MSFKTYSLIPKDAEKAFNSLPQEMREFLYPYLLCKEILIIEQIKKIEDNCHKEFLNKTNFRLSVLETDLRRVRMGK